MKIKSDSGTKIEEWNTRTLQRQETEPDFWIVPCWSEGTSETGDVFISLSRWDTQKNGGQKTEAWKTETEAELVPCTQPNSKCNSKYKN